MNIAQLIPNIRHIINDSNIDTDTFTEETNQALKYFIQAAVEQVASMPGYIGGTVTCTDSNSVKYNQRPDGLTFAEISVPSDFLKPVSLILKGWVLPVFEFFPAKGTAFRAQYNERKGIANGPHSPIAFISGDSNKTIIAHAVNTSMEPLSYELTYLPIPNINEDGSISMMAQYDKVVEYTAASLYLQSINEMEASTAAMQTALSLFKNITNVE